MRDNRTKMMMEVSFEYGGESFKEDVWVPFPIFVEAVRRLFDMNSVTLDGTDRSIWNLLVELNLIYELEDRREFIDLCRELYSGSAYEEEDYAEWRDEHEAEYGLGKYAEG